MSRARLLDLFCGAGGAAVGYHRAGFDVTGVDIAPQQNYPYAFHQADALEYLARHGHDFDAIHASPPCQAYVRSGMLARDGRYPDLLPATRAALVAVGVPWVIENVPGAPMRCDVLLCGSMFGLAIRRHRWFESSAPLCPFTPTCNHSAPITGVYGHPHGRGGAWRNGTKPMLPSDAATWARAMGIDWMTPREISQAIPPVYAAWIGARLLAALAPEEAAFVTDEHRWQDSTRASGRRGGQLVLQRYGPAFFAAIGRRAPRRDRAYYQAIGAVGGAVTAARYDADSREALARKGGEALLARRGKEYFAAIARIGWAKRRAAG